MVEHEFQLIAQECLKSVPVLEVKTKQIIEEMSKAAFIGCKEILDEYMDMEDMIYTQARRIPMLLHIGVLNGSQEI